MNCTATILARHLVVATIALGRSPLLEIVDDIPSSRALKAIDCYLGDYSFFSYPLRLLKRMYALFPAPRFVPALVRSDSQRTTSAMPDPCSLEDSLAS